jgi:hypothetical protein
VTLIKGGQKLSYVLLLASEKDACLQPSSQTDEEILKDEVADEAIEAASVAPGGFPTLVYGTYCFTCPSTIRSKVAQPG